MVVFRRMTEEDIMWQLQNMDPEEMEAMGINVESETKEEPAAPADEEQQQQEQQQQPAPQNDTAAQPSPVQPVETSTSPQISDEEKIELFTASICARDLVQYRWLIRLCVYIANVD